MTVHHMLTSNSWRNYYDAHPNTDASNKTLTGLGDIFTMSAADKDSFHAFCLNKDLFLLGVKLNGRELQLFHQVDIIGGSRLNPDKIHVTPTGHGARLTPSSSNAASPSQSRHSALRPSPTSSRKLNCSRHSRPYQQPTPTRKSSSHQ
jgi:hypothetical protein